MTMCMYIYIYVRRLLMYNVNASVVSESTVKFIKFWGSLKFIKFKTSGYINFTESLAFQRSGKAETL